MLVAGFFALSVWTFWMQRDEISLMLLASLTLAATLSANVGIPDIAALLCCVEAIFVLGIATAMTIRHSSGNKWTAAARRAQVIGLISLLKISVWIYYFAVAGVTANWNIYAASFNGLFIIQAIVAGGILDANLANFINLLHRIRRGFLRSVGFGGVV
jgi:hypothetical protein